MQVYISEYELRKSFIMYLITNSEIITVREKGPECHTVYGLSYEGVTIHHIEGLDKNDLINHLESAMERIVHYNVPYLWLLEGLYTLFIQDVSNYMKKILNPIVYVYKGEYSTEVTAVLDEYVFKVQDCEDPMSTLTTNILNSIAQDPNIIDYFIKERSFNTTTHSTLSMVPHAHNIWYPEYIPDTTEANWVIYDIISDSQYVIRLQGIDLETIHLNTQKFLTHHLRYLHDIILNRNNSLEFPPITVRFKEISEPFSSTTNISSNRMISKLLTRLLGGN